MSYHMCCSTYVLNSFNSFNSTYRLTLRTVHFFQKFPKKDSETLPVTQKIMSQSSWTASSVSHVSQESESEEVPLVSQSEEVSLVSQPSDSEMTERSSDSMEIRRANSEDYCASRSSFDVAPSEDDIAPSDDESLSGSSEGNSCADEVTDGYDTQISEDNSAGAGYFHDCEGFPCEDVSEELAYDAMSVDTLRPLYPGAQCTLLQALLQLGNLVSRGAVPLEAVDDFCKFEHNVKLPEGNIFPRSAHLFFKAFGIDKSKATDRRCEYHCCPKGCAKVFEFLPRSEWNSHHLRCKGCALCVCGNLQPDGSECDGERFRKRRGADIMPAAWGLYPGLETALESWHSDAEFRRLYTSFDRRFDRTDAYEPHSLLHTPFAQSLDGWCHENLNKSVYDLDVDLYNLGIDWEDVFKREEWSTGVVLVSPRGISSWDYGHVRWTRVVQWIGGPKQPVSLDGHLLLLARDVARLAFAGNNPDCPSKNRRSILFGLDADVPALKKLCSLCGHSAYTFCFRCQWVGNSLGGTVRHGGYCMPAQQTTALEREATKQERAKGKGAAKGKCEEVVDETDLWRYKSSEGKAIFAWDAVRYTDATLREEARNPTEDAHITGLNALMRCAPWLDLVHACNFPVAHTLNHGVGDGLLNCVFEKTVKKRVNGVWLSPAKGRQLDERLAAVVTVHDVSRPPKRVSEARGFWTYDDTAWMYALYLPLVGMQDILEEEWLQELFWHFTVLFRHCWFLCHPGEFYHNSWERAAQSAREVGVLIEKHALNSELTSNLHTVVCHMVESEAYAGALRVRREVWIEIALGILKVGTVNKVTQFPELQQWFNYQFSLAFNKFQSVCVKAGLQVPGDAEASKQPTSERTSSMHGLLQDWYSVQDPASDVGSVLQAAYPSSNKYRLFKRAFCGQQELVASMDSRLKVKRSCYFCCKDLVTYGEVFAFCELQTLTSSMEVALVYHFPLVRKEWHDQVAILNTSPSASTVCVLPLDRILGRVAVLAVTSNETRAVLVPSEVRNNLC